MTEKFPSTQFHDVQSSVFTHSELRQILSTYAQGVMNKGWKDYAISCEKNQTTFCVIERGQGAPMAVIYSISRTRSKNKDFYRVYEGGKQIFRSENFLETLNIFREIGKPGAKKKKSSHLKSV